ncbi:PQQ-binding-like beta-propeller repeat protein [Streptomyces sp. MB09-02B]|uniref:outer membrane protein assembly factor BamB family protein n=1 Tax=Streptomyces sp. MB09-02B TaxID=3028667 RepID=UPI0029A839CB|nr:PQQ-binding-like beta-propeller repeat protein [Streptomyces sp. MB09-02B]MDX3644659.1 PQQ-binding-like beta-propeller repeat protein [Streptomyces sp. MB09-02B]
MHTRPHRYDENGELRTTSARWEARRLNPPNPLWGSNGVAFGPDGRLYVAQFLAGQISAVAPATGDVEVVVPMDGPVQSPDDLAFGADGSMYIADLVPGRVWRRSPAGEYRLVSDAVTNPNGITCVGDRLFVNEMKPNGRLMELFPDGGDPVVLTEGLALGNAMQLGPDGHLYYPHMITGQVWRIPPDGGTPEVVAEDVHEPVAVRFDRSGVLHVLSRGVEGIVTRVDLHGSGTRTLVTSGLTGLDNAAFDAENRMFVSSYASGGVTEMHPDGRTREIVRRGLDGPYGVTIDLGGTVYAADHYRLASPTPEEVTTPLLLPFAHGITADGELLHYTSQFGVVQTYDPKSGALRERARGLNRPIGIAVGPDGALVVAETDAGRVVAIDDDGSERDDTVTALAEGLDRPTDVALDAEGRLYVSEERLGTVLRIEADGTTTVVADGLAAPQGLAVLGDDLFVVETGSRTLSAVSLTTGERRTDAEELPVGPPPGVVPRTEPALFADVMPGMARRFAGLTAAPDGTLLLSANGEGTVLRLTPRAGEGTGIQPVR